MNKKKPLSEQETKNKLIQLAKQMGCLPEFLQITERYERLLRNCTNQAENQHISIMGNVEIHKLFNFRNALVVNGQEIIPADENYKEEA